MLLGDIGQTALLASRADLEHAELTLFRPIKCMLASPEPTAEAIWSRFAVESPNESVIPSVVEGSRRATENLRQQDKASPNEPVVYVEDKFDGIRAQLHRGEKRVEIFSRDLRCITSQFDEIAERARAFSDEVILDGE